MKKNFLRDNDLLNFIIRNVIKTFQSFGVPVKKLTSLFRIYGITGLNIFGVRFKIFSMADDHIANEIFYNHENELDEFQLIKQLTKTSEYFIDVGANTGIFSLFTAKANKNLKILSFEPHPSNFNRLTRNIEINHFVNIKAYSFALGAHDCEIEITVPADLSLSTTASANEGFTKNFHHIEFTQILVKQRILDDILAEVPLTSRDVIKIDVEYYELEVLRGAESTLRHKRPFIVIEILNYGSLIYQFPEMKDKINKHHAMDVFNFLINLGYFCYALGADGLNFVKSPENKNTRNFLFAPTKLSEEYLLYSDITKY